MNVGLVLASVLVSAVATAPDPEPVLGSYDISVYVPGSGEVEPWQPTGASRTFVGDDLYSLIDGGAVIFYEYGFKQVITQDFTNGDGKSISLEIYEMDNPASAYGIFTLRRAVESKSLDVGDEGVLADYYLQFWKGHFLVTLTTSDSEDTSQSGMVAIARVVDSKINTKSVRPPLCDLLSIEEQNVRNIIYLRGDLALANSLPYVVDNVFKLKEGVIGDYVEFKIGLFKYGNQNESLKRYKVARDFFSGSVYFENLHDIEDGCIMTDMQGGVIQMQAYRKYIFIFMGNTETDPKSIFEKLQHNITEHLGT